MRVEFTSALVALINYMESEGDTAIIDYVLRSKFEQKRLFDQDLSKCDGEINKSKHQTGLAADLYIIKDGKMVDWSADGKAEKYHRFWETLGGKPVIKWDLGHFEF
jgi:hypothetical protein